MKTTLNFLMVLTICMMTLWSCSENESPISVVEGEGEVAFSFAAVNNTDISNKAAVNNRKLLNETPNQIMVTIQSSDDGSLVYDKEVLDVIAFNDNFISDPISLKTGNYELTEYFVLDEDSNTMYLTPLEGSTLAYLVNDPLGTNFSIAKDDSKQIKPEVIAPEGFDADDFGYTDFSFEVVESIDFLISAHIFDAASESYELTNASIQIVAEDDGTELYNNSLANAKQIRVRDGYNSYTITVTKSGYDDYVATLTNAELKTYANNPILVKLSPVIKIYNVKAKENSVSEQGEGLSVGTYDAGKTIIITTDSDDTWTYISGDTNSITNADGATSNIHTINSNVFFIGSLVGSFDNGTTFFQIGTRFEGVIPSSSELKLYFWDSDSDNNEGSIEVSIQVFE